MSIILNVSGGGSGFSAFANDDAVYVSTSLGANTEFEYYINGDFKGQATLDGGNFAVLYSAFVPYSTSGLLSHPAGIASLQIKSPVGSPVGSGSPYTTTFFVAFGDLAGTVVQTACNGFDRYEVRADGNGGFTNVTIEVNSEACGYVPVPPFGQAEVEAILTDYVQKSEVEAILTDYVQKSEINTFIQEWWSNEVQPELERLAVALEAVNAKLTETSTEISDTISAAIKDIEVQLTPTLNTEALGDQIAKLRELASQDGPGIKTVSSAETVSNAVLYHLYVTQAQILADPDASAEEQAESLAKLNNLMSSLTNNLGS